MTHEKMPEALRLAKMVKKYNAGVHSQAIVEDYAAAACELERQHAEIERLRAEVDGLRKDAAIDDLQDLVSKALRKAWKLGKTYWQQVDSEYASQWKKSDATQAAFNELVENTRAALQSTKEQP